MIFRQVVKILGASILIALPACAVLFASPRFSTSETDSVYVHGSIQDYRGSAVGGAALTFKGEKVTRTLSANKDGIYQVRLPPGLYTMIADYPSRQDIQEYERPLFRLDDSATDVLNVTFDPANPTCDVGGGTSRVVDPNPGEIVCGGQDLFSIAPQDKEKFQLLIRYRVRRNTVSGHTYNTGREMPGFQTQVFVAYNLLTLRADHVDYNVQDRMLKATGNVIVNRTDGTKNTADSMSFKLTANGEAIALP